MSAALWVVALAAWVAVGEAGCAVGQCAADVDCNTGTFCSAERQCRAECATDDECAPGWSCNADRGRCVENEPEDAGPKEDTGAAIDDRVDGGSTAEVSVDVGPPDTAAAPDVLDVPDVPAVMDVPDVPAVMDVPVARDTPDVVDVPVDRGVVVDVVDVVDVVISPVDTGPPVRRAYLDPCAIDADCASGACLTTSGGARYCTRPCAVTSQCGDGYLCTLAPAGVTSRCVPDDTGLSCTATAPNCARYCLSNAALSAAHCTRECDTGASCPAGFACEDAGAGLRVCVNVERPCTTNNDCTSGLCLDGGGGYLVCSSPCRSAADCPRRMTLDDGRGRAFTLPPYQCIAVMGQSLCVPPLSTITPGSGVILGNAPLGGSCGANPSSNLCYSGVCDTGTNTCVQGCTPTAGCPSGFACLPWQPNGTGTPVYLACLRVVTGTSTGASACARAADCASGLCLGPPVGSPPHCSRYCADRICPTGLRCVPDGTAYDGTPLSLCVR